MDHQLGFIQSLRNRKVGNAIGTFAPARHFRPIDFPNQLGCFCHNQTSVVRDGAGDSRKFDILSGVRQGCVLSPRLFCAALELATSEWGIANPQGGMDPGDDMFPLFNLHFADAVYIFANTKENAQNILDSSVLHLAAAGLMLNTSGSHMIKVLGHTKSHKWVGCMLCACPGQDSDVENHLKKLYQHRPQIAKSNFCVINVEKSAASARSYIHCCFLGHLREIGGPENKRGRCETEIGTLQWHHCHSPKAGRYPPLPPP